ncbi:ATP-dependent DNA/RNA helicase [Lobulomyces angularis]|nr:ATP-dependent DNA/RNA helicase [Lobulomyces angularis]
MVNCFVCNRNSNLIKSTIKFRYFHTLNLSKPTCAAVKNIFAFEKPTLTQQKIIPLLVKEKKKHVVISAQTGSGKTLAYLLPTINSIDADKTDSEINDTNYKKGGLAGISPKAMIVVPNKQLASQLLRVLRKLKIKGVFFPQDPSIPLSKLKFSDIMVTIPELLLESNNLHKYEGTAIASILSNTNTIIIDEADTILSTTSGQNLIKTSLKIKNLQHIFVSASLKEIVDGSEECFLPKNWLKRQLKHSNFLDMKVDGTHVVPGNELFLRIFNKETYVPRRYEDLPKKITQADKENDLKLKCVVLKFFVEKRLMEIKQGLTPGVLWKKLILERDLEVSEVKEDVNAGEETVLVFCNSNWRVEKVFEFLKENFLTDSFTMTNNIRIESLTKEDPLKFEIISSYTSGGSNIQTESGKDGTKREDPPIEQLDMDQNSAIATSSSSSDVKKGKLFKILVATDLVNRGLDFHNVSLVFNLDFPPNAQTYLHRAGRTARAGSYGEVLSLIAEKDERLAAFIEGIALNKTRKIGAISSDLGSIFSRKRSFSRAIKKKARELRKKQAENSKEKNTS